MRKIQNLELFIYNRSGLLLRRGVFKTEKALKIKRANIINHYGSFVKTLSYIVFDDGTSESLK